MTRPSSGGDESGFQFRKLGSVRPSQMTHTYGIGSVVEFPFVTAVVKSHAEWNVNDRDGERVSRVVHEPRLLAAVRHDLGPQIHALRTPPVRAEQPGRKPNQDKSNWVGVDGMPFPRWYRCTRCNTLLSVDQGVLDWRIDAFRPQDAGYYHVGCHGQDRRAIPVRAVAVCEAGHLDDFPWVEYAHRRADKPYVPCDGPDLALTEGGWAERATDLTVDCKACDAPPENLNFAFLKDGPPVMPLCRGYYAHTNQWDPRGCKHRSVAIMVGASNLWFPLRRSVLTIPGVLDAAQAFFSEHHAKLLKATKREDLDTLADPDGLAAYDPLVDAKDRLDLDHLWTVIDNVHKATETEGETEEDDETERVEVDILGPEWESLTRVHDSDDPDFTLRVVGPPASSVASLLGSARQLTRLREVVALTGFTRLDAFDPDEDEPGPRRAPLAPIRQTRQGGYRDQVDWVPVAESRGEGVFVTLDEEPVQAWETTAVNHARIGGLREAHRAWQQMRRKGGAGRPVTPRYVLLHSFSHLLVNELALHAGYNTASIRERIYSREPGSDGSPPMAGFLLYTSESDSEGTLGGLVSLGQADRLGTLIDSALTRATVCSTDPFCAEHMANPTEPSVHGAACHSCLFLPETSCEAANRRLDRSVLVPTMAPNGTLAFFPQP